ncbi:unnamed protein product, partial [Didymodactylos carnosus]
SCLAPNKGGCDQNANCSHGDGNAVVCTCNTGYSGDGTSGNCQDSCLAPETGGCDQNANCSHDVANAVVCTCIIGYSGDGTSGNCQVQHTCFNRKPHVYRLSIERMH